MSRWIRAVPTTLGATERHQRYLSLDERVLIDNPRRARRSVPGDRATVGEATARRLVGMAEWVKQWGALQVARGRLWLGQPHRRLAAMHFAISLEATGIHCYGGGEALVSRRRTAWDEISSITVGLTASPGGAWSSWYGPFGGPFAGIGLEWSTGTRFDRYLAVASTNWEGDLSELALLGTQRLLEALCRTPAMRHAIASEDSVVDLLGRLAAAQEIEGIEEILRPG